VTGETISRASTPILASAWKMSMDSSHGLSPKLSKYMSAPFRIYSPLNTNILGRPKIDKVSRLVMPNLGLMKIRLGSASNQINGL
jgi:hypothetical protein